MPDLGSSAGTRVEQVGQWRVVAPGPAPLPSPVHPAAMSQCRYCPRPGGTGLPRTGAWPWEPHFEGVSELSVGMGVSFLRCCGCWYGPGSHDHFVCLVTLCACKAV